MGGKNNTAGRLYLIGPDGEAHTIEMPLCDLVETPEAENGADMLLTSQTWEIRCTLPKILRCRSRKRLIKLLMSTDGVDRNAACERSICTITG